MLKAKAVRLFGILLAAGGSLALLYSIALFASRKGLLPQFQWLDPRAWLPADELVAPLLARVDIAVLVAVLGAMAMAAGILVAIRRTVFLRAEKRRREDGLRRVQQYRADEGRCPYDSRLEPFLGPVAASRRDEDRRVA